MEYVDVAYTLLLGKFKVVVCSWLRFLISEESQLRLFQTSVQAYGKWSVMSITASLEQIRDFKQEGSEDDEDDEDDDEDDKGTRFCDEVVNAIELFFEVFSSVKSIISSLRD